MSLSLVVLSTGLAVIAGMIGEAEQPPRQADQLAQTCLSEGLGLFVLGIAAGRESPNENAARQAGRIAQICRTARTNLQPTGHVCLPALESFEQLAASLAEVYSGRISAVDFAASLDERDLYGENDAGQIKVDEQCEARMSALEETKLAGNNQ